MFYSTYIKRVIDILGSVLLLLAGAPILIITAGLLAIQNKRKILFYQKRPGYQEVPFYVIKFRTMTDQRDEEGNLLPNNERITSVGKWIRKLSVDEMPQLFNVLRGDMSLVGPRPLLMKYLPLYTDRQRRRHEVKPGVTGWAQVNGRNAISWEKKFELDLYYVENISLWLDMKIILLTIIKVLKREGINQSESQPMQPFEGIN